MENNQITALRRDLLSGEIKRQGLAVVSRKAGKPDRQINDMVAGRKSFGDKVARDIGPKIRPDLPADWLLSPSADADTPTEPVLYDEHKGNVQRIMEREATYDVLSNDEKTIVSAFRLFVPELRENWLDAAHKQIQKQAEINVDRSKQA